MPEVFLWADSRMYGVLTGPAGSAPCSVCVSTLPQHILVCIETELRLPAVCANVSTADIRTGILWVTLSRNIIYCWWLWWKASADNDSVSCVSHQRLNPLNHDQTTMDHEYCFLKEPKARLKPVLFSPIESASVSSKTSIPGLCWGSGLGLFLYLGSEQNQL